MQMCFWPFGEVGRIQVKVEIANGCDLFLSMTEHYEPSRYELLAVLG
jgi:hypothetical protein